MCCQNMANMATRLACFFFACALLRVFSSCLRTKNAFLVGRVLDKNLMQQLMPTLMPNLMPQLMLQLMLELMPLEKNLMQQLMPNLMPNLMPQLMLRLMLELMLQFMLEQGCGPSTMIDFNMVRVAYGLS